MSEDKDDRTKPMTSPVKDPSPKDPAELSTLISGSRPSSEKGALIDNRFVIQRELGRGGIGVAYLAIDTRDNDKNVVLKVLLAGPGEENAAWVERKFGEEVKALARINHPGVVKLISSGKVPEKRPYLAMEFVDGDDLRSFIEPEKGIREFDRIASFIRQLGEALSAAHDVGIYHRDLKPENIMVCGAAEALRIKVIDFGIATVKESLDEKTKTTMLAGSVRYMAPEQIFGKPTGASDIYALGVIAYEMITGRVPFNPDLQHPLAAMQQLLEMQRNGVRVMPKDLRPSLPERAQQIVLKGLSYPTAARYQRADEFGRELATALTEQDPEALSESYINRTINRAGSPIQYPLTELNESIRNQVTAQSGDLSSRKNRQWRIAGGITALLIIVAVGLAGWVYLSGRATRQAGTNPSNAAVKHTFTYFVSAQKYKNSKPDGEPMRLLGSEMYFNTGDGLRFFITSSDKGRLYMLSEEATGHSDQYNLLFPTPKANHSSSQIRGTI